MKIERMANTAYYSTDYTPTFRNNNGFISYSYVSTVPTTMNDFEENCCGGGTSYKMLFQLQYVPIVEKTLYRLQSRGTFGTSAWSTM